MSKWPLVLHISPFEGLAGGNRALLTLGAEMARRGPAFFFCLSEDDLAKEARKMGMEVRTAHGTSPWSKSKLSRWTTTCGALRRAVEEFNIDLMHSHSAIGNHYCWPVKLMTGVPLVTHQRDNYVADYFHFGIGAANHIITVSNWILRGLPPRLAKKATAIHDAVEIPDISPPPPHDGPVRIGMAGRCFSIKGQDLVVDAAAMLADKHDFVVHMWGMLDNDYGQFIRARIAALPPHVRDRFHLEGFRSDVENFYKLCDLVIIPSRYPDPFPRMVTEPMAHYLPVIVAAHGGMVEIVDHDVTGLHFKPDDVTNLAQQLDRLLSDPDLRQRLGYAGRRAVEQRLNPDLYLRECMKIYEKVLGQPLAMLEPHAAAPADSAVKL